MTRYRIQYTKMKPGGTLEKQDDLIHGTLEDVRMYIDTSHVHGRSPITITECTKSDGYGRVVPASEWDVYE